MRAHRKSVAFRFLRHFFQDQFEELRREVFNSEFDCLVIEASFLILVLKQVYFFGVFSELCTVLPIIVLTCF